MKRFRDTKGFTLVELIVVIAIIAILAAVSIVGYQNYIDRGRFSNDTQTAANMSDILQNHLILNPEESVDAHDVREIVQSYSNSSISFTPESSYTGFFYLSTSNKVIASKYDDIEEILESELLGSFSQSTSLLSNHEINELERNLNTPEELFGDGTFLLTTSGSVVANTVYALRNLSLSASLVEDYSTLLAYVDNPGLLVRNTQKEKLEELVNSFNPETTIFVNNVTWLTASEDNINKIVFAPGISNIPTQNYGIQLDLNSDEISLPKTVKSIEADAFADLDDDLNIIMPTDVRVHPDAFKSTQTGQGDFVELDLEALLDYSEFVKITIVGTNTKYEFHNIPDDLRKSITGYRATSTAGQHEIYIYTKDGLTGFARQEVKVYTIIYYYNVKLGDPNILLTYETTSNIFLCPMQSMFSGYDIDNYEYVPDGLTFQGWNTQHNGLGSTLEDGDALPEIEGEVIKVYGVWS
jgi:prepilin-type N-terminal cleavage/methylation domain-containing protein